MSGCLTMVTFASPHTASFKVISRICPALLCSEHLSQFPVISLLVMLFVLCRVLTWEQSFSHSVRRQISIAELEEANVITKF